MTKRRKPKLKEKIRVVTDDFDHPFKSNTLVEVTEILIMVLFGRRISRVS
ncbi:hypothetical protein B37_00494 [Bacillus licheniformis]|nr:hypothetical protein B37_00494 [Bacillus licheniformis]ARW56532.1 hypothetical protein S100027_04568 [Bacillus licheniformis]